MPRGKLEPGSGRNGRNLNAVAYSHVIQALLDRACSREDVMEASGLGPVLVSKLLVALRARGKHGDTQYNSVMHIAEWRKDARGYPTIRAFRLGPGMDAVQPKKTRAQIAHDYLERRKAKRFTRPAARKTKTTGAANEHPRIDRILATGG